jgi:C-terminal processing protease CtpA/Prc
MAGAATRLAADTGDAALIRRRTWHGPDPALATFEWTKQKVHPGRQPRYTGRVVVLIDARAVSAAEHVCLLLEAATHPTFIGTPTKGADGEVTNIALPGGIQVNFAALEVRHADGRPVQGLGILPDVWAAPTISGIRQGRDEVLERAVEFLRLRP